MQEVQISREQDWDVVIQFAGDSDAIVADVSAVIIHLLSADTSSELSTGRAPPLAVANEVQMSMGNAEAVRSAQLWFAAAVCCTDIKLQA